MSELKIHHMQTKLAASTNINLRIEDGKIVATDINDTSIPDVTGTDAKDVLEAVLRARKTRNGVGGTPVKAPKVKKAPKPKKEKKPKAEKVVLSEAEVKSKTEQATKRHFDNRKDAAGLAQIIANITGLSVRVMTNETKTEFRLVPRNHEAPEGFDKKVSTIGPKSGSIVLPKYKVEYEANDGHCGDDMAVALTAFCRKDDKLDMDAVMSVAKANGVDLSPYSKLNNGQKRMILGDRLRGLVNNGTSVKIGKVEFKGTVKVKKAKKARKPKKKS